MRSTVRIVLLMSMPAACASSSDSAPAGSGSDATVDVAGGSSVIFDDLTFSKSLGRLVAAPGGTGKVNLIDPGTLDVTSIEGFSLGTASADEGGGLVFAADRTNNKLEVADPAQKKIVASVSIDSVDYVRYSPVTHEVWITQPAPSRIEVMTLPQASPPTPNHAAFIMLNGGPEGLVFDVTRKRAYAHLFSGNAVVIDVTSRAVVATWPTGCSMSHGIPAIDEARGFLFVGCRENAKVTVLDLDKDGKQLGSYTLGSGETILTYAPQLGHFYLRGDPGLPVAMLGVSSTGGISLLGTVQSAERGHCETTDDRGNLWVCDTATGRLLRFPDTHPSSIP
jgi:hypothetical protein